MKTLFLMTAIALAAVAPAEAEAQGKRGKHTKHKVVIHVDDDFRVDEDHEIDEDFGRRGKHRKGYKRDNGYKHGHGYKHDNGYKHGHYRPVDNTYARRHGYVLARLKDDRQDLYEIKEIAKDWKYAAKYGHWRAERRADRRLAAWLNAELREPTLDYRDTERTRRVARELRAIQPAFRYGHAAPGLYAKKRALLKRLVRISERELEQTRYVVKYGPMKRAFVYTAH